MRALLLIVFLATCFSLIQASSSTPKCNDTIIKNIEHYWETCGLPGNVFQEKGLTWSVYRSTEHYRDNGVRCLTYTNLGNGQLNASTNGNVHTITVNEEKLRYVDLGDGEEHFKIKACVESGIYCGYHCSYNGTTVTAENPDDGGVVVTKYAKKRDIKKALKLMKKLGFTSLNYSFDCKNCDGTSNEGTNYAS